MTAEELAATCVAQQQAWEALALINISKPGRLTPREETALAELQDAARELVVSTSRAHREALTKYRAAIAMGGAP